MRRHFVLYVLVRYLVMYKFMYLMTIGGKKIPAREKCSSGAKKKKVSGDYRMPEADISVAADVAAATAAAADTT